MTAKSILSFDPKYSNKDMFVLEVVFREITINGEPIIIPGLFMFSRQNTVTFDIILDMLLEAEPSFARAALVMSDGCETFGDVIDKKFRYAFHGVDRNHVEKNIVHYLQYEMGLQEGSIKKWKRRVYRFLRGEQSTGTKGLYDFEDRALAAAFFKSETEHWPDKLKAYITKNKREILIGVHSLAARRAAGLTRDDGTTDFAWSQCSESAHMVVVRWLENQEGTYKNTFEAMERYMDATIVKLNNCRHGQSKEWKLKSMYSHLEQNPKEFLRATSERKTGWIPIKMADLRNDEGKIGVQLNTICFKAVDAHDASVDQMDEDSEDNVTDLDLPELTSQSTSLNRSSPSSNKLASNTKSSLSYSSSDKSSSSAPSARGISAVAGDHVSSSAQAVNPIFQFSSLVKHVDAARQKINLDGFSPADMDRAVNLSLSGDKVVRPEVVRLETRITLHGLLNADHLVRRDGNCGPDTVAALQSEEDGTSAEDWKENREAYSEEVRAKIATFLKPKEDVAVQGMRGVTFGSLPRVKEEESYADFCTRMALPGQWWEIACWAAVAAAFKNRVALISSDHNDNHYIYEFEPIVSATQSHGIMWVGYVAGIHYFPLSASVLRIDPAAAKNNTPSLPNGQARESGQTKTTRACERESGGSPKSVQVQPESSPSDTQIEQELARQKRRDEIIEQLLVETGIISNTNDCIGFLNLSKHRAQLQITKASNTAYYMKTNSEGGVLELSGEVMTKALACSCKNGSSPRGKTLSNLCAHKLGLYIYLFAANDELEKMLRKLLPNYKKCVEPSAVSVSRGAAGLVKGQKEKAIGHKSQQPAAAADKIQPIKGAEKKLKAVNCGTCSKKIQPGWGRCATCNTPRPVDRICPNCQTNFGVNKIKFCPMTGCNVEFKDKLEDDNGLGAAESGGADALLALAHEGAQPGVGRSINSARAAIESGTEIDYTNSSNVNRLLKNSQ